MNVSVWYFGAAGAYVSAAAGLAGALIGGGIAGVVTLKVAHEAREQAERSWMRDSRRDIYDRFLAAGQKLLAVMESAASTKAENESRAGKLQDESDPVVDAAYAAYFETYASVQTVAELRVVKPAREHAYLLQALKDALDDGDRLRSGEFHRIAQVVRLARQDTIDAMRADLDLRGSAKPPAGYTRAAVAAAARKGQRIPYP
jgi:hypothetical protein